MGDDVNFLSNLRVAADTVTRALKVKLADTFIGIDQSVPGTTNAVDVRVKYATPSDTELRADSSGNLLVSLGTKLDSANDSVAALDGGFSKTTAHQVTAITDTTVTAITAAPTAGQKRALVDLVISTDTAQNVTVKEETSGTVLHGPFYLPANSVFQLSTRSTPVSKLATADKKYTVTCSAASHHTTIETWSYSEA